MKANELDRGWALIALGNKRKYCSNILSSNVACSVLIFVWMDHWKGSNLDVSNWRWFNWREPFGWDEVLWNYLGVDNMGVWKLSNSEGKVTFGSRVHCIEGHHFFGGTVVRGTIGKWEMSHFEGASHLEPGPLRGVKVGESQGHEKPLFFILATLVARTSTTLG